MCVCLQFDECSAALDELSAQFPGSPVPALARAALLVKQKNVTDAVKLLEVLFRVYVSVLDPMYQRVNLCLCVPAQAFAVSNPAHAPEARLTIAQLFLNEGLFCLVLRVLLCETHVNICIRCPSLVDPLV